MIRNAERAILLSVLLVTSLVGAAAAPAAASHDGGDDEGIFEQMTPDDDGYVSAAISYGSGYLGRVSYWVSGPENSAEESRDAMMEAFNTRNESFLSYANDRGLHQGEVVQVDCELEDETATAYLVADYNATSDEYETARFVRSTNRTVDHEVVLKKGACDNAAEEIEGFHDEFVAEDRNITTSYVSKMAGKYSSSIEEPFTGGN